MTASNIQLVHETLAPRSGHPPYPGVVFLHGRGSNEQDLLSLGPELDPRLYVVSARAPFAFGPGSYYWYDLEASMAGRPSRESIEYSIDLVRQLIATTIDAHNIDAARLFIAGFSMGGAMTAAVMLMHPEEIAGALIFSGYVPIHSNLPWNLATARNKPVFEGHGTYDDVLPVEFGRMSRDFLVEAGVALTYREYPIAHSISPAELADAASWMRERLNGASAAQPGVAAP